MPLDTTLAAVGTHEYEGFIGWVLSLMQTLGEVGVGLALLVETFFPPMPSEAVLPGAGFLAWAGQMSFVGAIVGATVGGLVGAWIWYWIGAAFGRRRTMAVVARIPLLETQDFLKAEAFFARWGAWAVLIGRCVPMVRSFISIPAGVERMAFWKFSVYTTIGSAIWNTIWIGLGYAFGPAIEPILAQWSGLLSRIMLAILAALTAWFVVVRLRTRARRAAALHEAVIEVTGPESGSEPPGPGLGSQGDHDGEPHVANPEPRD